MGSESSLGWQPQTAAVQLQVSHSPIRGHRTECKDNAFNHLVCYQILLLAQIIRWMSLGRWLLTVLPSFLPLWASLSQFCFFNVTFFLFSSCSHLPQCVVPPAYRNKPFTPRALSQGSAMSVSTENPFQPAEGDSESQYFSLSLSLMNYHFLPLHSPGCWTPPCFALPFLVCGWVPRGAPMPSMPADPRLLPGSGRAERESRKPKSAIQQHHEADGNSLS